MKQSQHKCSLLDKFRGVVFLIVPGPSAVAALTQQHQETAGSLLFTPAWLLILRRKCPRL